MLKSFINYMQNHKKAAAIAGVIIIFVIIPIAITVITSKQESSVISVEGEWTEEQVHDFENNDQFAFTNRRVMDVSLDDKLSTTIYNNLKDYVLSDSEKKTAPHKNEPGEGMPERYYTGSMSDFRYIHPDAVKNNPMQAFVFNLSVTDGRLYQVDVAFDNLTTARNTVSPAKHYLAVLLRHSDDGSTKPVLYINRITNERDADIWAWLSAVGLSKDSVDVKESSMVEYQQDSNGKYQVVSGNVPTGYSSVDTPSDVMELNTTLKLVDGLAALSKGDRVRLYFACPTNITSSMDNCVVYKYDLYE